MIPLNSIWAFPPWFGYKAWIQLPWLQYSKIQTYYNSSVELYKIRKYQYQRLPRPSSPKSETMLLVCSIFEFPRAIQLKIELLQRCKIYYHPGQGWKSVNLYCKSNVWADQRNERLKLKRRALSPEVLGRVGGVETPVQCDRRRQGYLAVTRLKGQNHCRRCINF